MTRISVLIIISQLGWEGREERVGILANVLCSAVSASHLDSHLLVMIQEQNSLL